MRLGSRILLFLVLAVLAFWFTAENSRELVTVDLFFFRLRASLPLVVFGSMLLGMLSVFLVGLRADLRTRRLLDRYRQVIEREGPTSLGGARLHGSAADAAGREVTYGAVAGPSADATPTEDSSPEEGRSDDRRASTTST